MTTLKHRPIFQGFVIFSFYLALLFVQISGLHLHAEQHSHLLANSIENLSHNHTHSTAHFNQVNIDSYYHNELESESSVNIIHISPDSLKQHTTPLDLGIILLFIGIFFSYIYPKNHQYQRHTQNLIHKPFPYNIRPPLRAPPLRQ